MTLALGTGARKNELLHVRYCDIQTQSGLITYRETKNGSTRSVALTGVALSTVRDYLTQHPDIPTALIFARESNLAVPMSFRDACERAVRRAQLTDVCFHTLRHTCGSHLAMSGASLLDISVVLGHHNIQMSKRYRTCRQDI